MYVRVGSNPTPEWQSLEGPSADRLVHLPAQRRVSLSSWVLNISKDEDSTTSLGNPCQCLTTLTIFVPEHPKTKMKELQMPQHVPGHPLDTRVCCHAHF